LKASLERAMVGMVQQGEEIESGMEQKNLLFIPHTPPSDKLVTRGEALARGLSFQFRVFLLSWRGVTPLEQSMPVRLVSRLAGLFTAGKPYTKDRLTVVETPLLYVRRTGMEFLRGINTRMVNRTIRRYDIDVIVNQLALVNSRDLAGPHIIDIVDLPAPREMRRWSRQAERAAGITTITEGLKEVLAANGMGAEVLPNGATLARFKDAASERVRERFGVASRFVIGYVGNHAEWSGLPFLLDVFKLVKAEVPEAFLMIVGMGSQIPEAKAKVARESIGDVLFTGPVDASLVADYFKAIDLGVLPFELDPHAALSFPIKVIEYSAAHKIVVASPLEVLKYVGLPNVRIVERDINLWAEAIIESKDVQWNEGWDTVVEAYDWENLSSRMASFIRSRIPL
jgi:glycosyltransferase involved in cell wall biosynthesis